MRASAASERVRNSLTPRLRKPWEVLDVESLPHLDVNLVFGELSRKREDGRFLQACCPIHKGSEPEEFSIDPARLDWICFMGCGGGGPVQFLQRSRGLSWVEATQALAVMAGVDPSKLALWGEHWTTRDFQLHEQLENRSALLRVFMAVSRSLFEAAAGETLKRDIARRFLVSEDGLDRLSPGLYSTPEDIFHFLKRTGQDLSQLQEAGFFEPRWAGRLVCPWKDLSGRTVNLAAWNTTNPILTKQAPAGDVLFNRDSIGAQRTPFLLHEALELERRDLLLLDDPLQALQLGCAGLEDPFPIAAVGTLTAEQVEILERVLAEDGTLTILSRYDPQTYGSAANPSTRNLKLLETVSFPVFVVDSRLMAEDREKAMGPAEFLQAQGFDELLQILKQCEVVIAPTSPETRVDSFWPRLGEAITSWRGGREDSPAGHSELAEASPPPVPASALGTIFEAAEEIGSRIAQGFLRSLPTSLGANLEQRTEEGPFQAPVPQLPAPGLDQDAPPQFSVERLDLESRSRGPIRATGWPSLDERGIRFCPGELTAVGGRSGHGRTSLLLNLMVHWLPNADDLILFCSFKESEIQLYHRLLSLLTANTPNPWTTAQVQDALMGASKSAGDSAILEEARAMLTEWQDRIQLVYRPAWTLSDLDRHLHTLREERDLGAVLIDPLDQIARHPGPNKHSLPGARWLKGLAVELGCPFVASLAPDQGRPAGASSGLTDGEHQTPAARRLTLEDFPVEVSDEADLILGLQSQGGGRLDGKSTEIDLEVGVLKSRSGLSADWVRLSYDPRFGCLKEPARESEGISRTRWPM